MKKQKPKRGLVYRHNDHHEFFLFEKKTLFALIAVSVLTLLVYFFGTDARQFLTNIVTPLPEHAPFDGTVTPIKQVPNWAKLTEAERKAVFSAIPQDKLISLPPYIPERLTIPFEKLEWNNASHDQIRNEKITYAVPYLGSYELDGVENAGSHPAIDIKVPEGTPVTSIANGVVVKIGSGSGFGNHIVIQHNNMPLLSNPEQKETLYSAYAHLSQILASDRMVVSKGQLIGYSGSTGFSTTPHLHFQIDRDSAPWHPYWPFTAQEQNVAGLSFVQAINAGLGKDKALVNTVNSMKYVQQFITGGTLVAATETPLPATVAVPQTLQEALNFKIELPANEFTEGDKINLTITLLDAYGNILKDPKFQDRLKIELLNNRGNLNRKFMTAGFFLTGSTDVVEITDTTPGAEKIIVRFLDKEYLSDEFTIKPKAAPVIAPEVLLPQEKPFEPLVYKPEDKARMSFPRISIQASKSTVNVGEPVELLIQYFNENTENTAPPSGIYFLNTIPAGTGNFSASTIKSEDFVNGISKTTFTPTAAGQTAVMLSGGALNGFSEGIEVKNPAAITETPPATPPEIPSSSERVFTDIEPGSEYEEALKFLKQEGVTKGYPDGSFQPNKEVLRVEALKMIFEALKQSVSQDIGNLLFPDLQAGAWYLPYVKKAFVESVVQGYPDGTFRPNANVNMVEFYKMLFLASKTDIDPEIIVQLPNGVKEDDWFAPYIQEAVKKNILEIKENPLQPGKPMTRGEIAKALYKLMKIRQSGKGRFE